MKEWRYLVFLVKYHLNRWIREKKQGGVFYIGGSDVFPPPLKPEEELVLLEQLGGEEDVTVKAVLIERNLRLVVYIARKFENTGINVEDLISIGTIGLIKAINNFNTELDVKFSTYAVPMIIGEIRRYLRDNNSIRVSRSLRDIAYRAIYAKETYMKTKCKLQQLQSANEVVYCSFSYSPRFTFLIILFVARLTKEYITDLSDSPTSLPA